MNIIPHLPLAMLPTPVHELPRLSAALGGPRLLVKRDDLTGLAFGGNKTRKLAYLLADARAHGADVLITAGAVQSNHCRQTAAAAAWAGMDCVLVLRGEAPARTSANLLLDGVLGARVRWAGAADRATVMQDTARELAAHGRRPYIIPYGGSNALGAAAYAYALHELVAQLGDTHIDRIVFASSSGGTQAGLVAGALSAGFRGEVYGISVDEPEEHLCEVVAALATDVAQLLGLGFTVMHEEVLVNDAYIGAGYAIMGPAEREAIALVARTEGLLVDPVYTGRALAGLIDLVRRGAFGRHETVLFWHTGGQPALFAAEYQELGDGPAGAA